jgi:hypothetical protein
MGKDPAKELAGKQFSGTAKGGVAGKFIAQVVAQKVKQVQSKTEHFQKLSVGINAVVELFSRCAIRQSLKNTIGPMFF